ncbi:hypothetical protein HDU85_004108 [Gaertneriomyces sp. JEL0708]|nr:hypothetical protein HDU85_004108 [Gaertneriomyces sp. JEL0708]
MSMKQETGLIKAYLNQTEPGQWSVQDFLKYGSQQCSTFFNYDLDTWMDVLRKVINHRCDKLAAGKPKNNEQVTKGISSRIAAGRAMLSMKHEVWASLKAWYRDQRHAHQATIEVNPLVLKAVGRRANVLGEILGENDPVPSIPKKRPASPRTPETRRGPSPAEYQRAFLSEDHETVCPPTEQSLYAIRQPVFLDVETDMVGKEPEVDTFFEVINVSQQFLGYQKAAFRIGQTQGLTFESHVHEMLALSSVLLVKPAEHSRVQLEFFQESFLDRFGGHVLASIGLAPSELTNELTLFLRKTCKEVAMAGALSDSLDARILDRMISQPKEKRILDTFRTLLRDLPKKKISMASDPESDLIASYLHPFVKLFFGRNALVRLSWPNTASTAAVQAKTEMAQSGQARQPDMKMFTVKASREHQEVGYGEVKVQSRQDDTLALNVDLYRLGKFAKMAIDQMVRDGMESPVITLMQVVGTYACFRATNTSLVLTVPLFNREEHLPLLWGSAW